MDYTEFRKWLDEHTEYQQATKNNVISRIKRANSLCPITTERVYLFHLSENEKFKELTSSVKSQIRRAVRLYHQFEEWKREERV